MKTLFILIDILIMFLSGVLLMEFFGLSWEYVRILEFVHIVASIVLSLFFLLPFLYRHIKETGRFGAKSLSGIGFLFLFLALLLSGTYLFLVGNRGGDALGILAHQIHLYGSFVLLGLLLAHVKRLFLPRSALAASFLLLILYIPGFAKEPLSNIELEKGVSRYHVNDWTNSATCKTCHPEIFKQWANSNHRHLADSNPYYMVLENLAEMDMGVGFRTWCMGCHNPSAVTMKQQRTTHMMQDNTMPEPLFTKDGKNLLQAYKEHPDRLEQGVGCIACHRITDATAKGNSSFRLQLRSHKKYLFEDSHTPLKVWFSQKLINAMPHVHKEEYMKPLYKKSRYCASCHDEFLPHSAKQVVSTYKQWERSVYNDPKNPQEHKECLDCHMKYMKDGEYATLEGSSTLGGKKKKDIKVHYFAGGNHFLAGLKSKENESQSIQLLKHSATLDATIQNDTLFIGVTNSGAGHKLPTGAADFRELWLDVTVTDANGNVILSSGKLDASGNIEKGSIVYNKVFGDKEGNPVGLFFWRYEKLLKDNRIDPKERRVERFPIPKDAKRPLHLDLKLNFRIYPQWVTDIVKAAYPQLPDPPVVTIAHLEQTYE